MNGPFRYLPWMVAGAASLFFLFLASPAEEAPDQLHLRAASGITVLDKGRYKPLDTYARVQLLRLGHRQAVYQDKVLLQPVQWLLDVMSYGLANRYQLIHINDRALLNLFQLDPARAQYFDAEDLQEGVQALKPAIDAVRDKPPEELTTFDLSLLDLLTQLNQVKSESSLIQITNPKLVAAMLPIRGARFTLADLRPGMKAFQEELEPILKKIEKNVQLTEAEQEKVLVAIQLKDADRGARMLASLASRNVKPRDIPVFRLDNIRVINLLGLDRRSGLRYNYNEITSSEMFPEFRRIVEQARRRDEKARDAMDVKALELDSSLSLYRDLEQLAAPGMVPLSRVNPDWKSLSDALGLMNFNGRTIPVAVSLTNILFSYAVNEKDQFNKEVASYLHTLDTDYSKETETTGLELFFNQFEPFYWCSIFYVLVFLLSCCAWFGWTDTLNKSALYLAVVVVVVHTAALLLRMYIQGRPPVTNLYSSAVFIGWGCVLLCIVLEFIFRNGCGNIVASVLGALTLQVASYLGGGGDTMEVLQAVLATNFWLATHVTCVTMGYTATFVAGFLGMIYIARGVFTPSLDRDMAKSLGYMIYGVVCFATLLSFVGTVLGGIWADQSWGRFWGWDPKENGALLIVIWNALLLHARWAGMVKDRGMALLSLGGNMVTGWSWFGTNQLGVGLHAYGFNKEELADGLVIFWASQVIFLICGSLPLKYWRSFAARQAPPSLPQTEPLKVGGKFSSGLKPA